MGKYLLLVVGVMVIYWVVRASLRRRRDRDLAAKQSQTIADDMVRCADCGVHLPRSESLAARGQFYCSAEHQRRKGPS